MEIQRSQKLGQVKSPRRRDPGETMQLRSKGRSGETSGRETALESGEVDEKEDEETVTKEKNKIESGTEDAPVEDLPMSYIALEEACREITVETEDEPTDRGADI